MKKIAKLLVAVTVLTVLFAMPIMATETNFNAEVNAINAHVLQVEKEVDALTTKQTGFATEAQLNAHRRTVMNQTLNWANAEFDNYILFLGREVENSKETARIKQQNVVAFTELCKVNPTMSAQLLAAQNELAAAQQQVINNQAAVEATKQAKAAQAQAIMLKAASYK